MIIDVRTMYIAMAATSFIVAAALSVIEAGRFRRDGTLQWVLGWAVQGAYSTLLGLRGIAWDFVSIVVANVCLATSYSLLYAAVREFQGRSYSRRILLFPPAAMFLFVSYFSIYTDNVVYRSVFISVLSILQIGAVARLLFREAPVYEKRSYRLTGFAFLVAGVLWLGRLIEAFALRHGHISAVPTTTSLIASIMAGSWVAILSSMGFVLMIRGRAERALLETEQRWATTLSSIGDAVIAADVTGRVTFMNAVAEGLTGWTASEASMKPVPEIFNIVNEQTRNAVESPVAVLREGVVVGLANHTILVRKDETKVPIDDSGAPIRNVDGKITGVVLVFRDITGRKQAEETIQANLQRFYTVLSSMYTGLLLVTDGGQVEFANQAFCDYFDLTEPPADLVGLTSSEILAKIGKAYLYPDEALGRVKEIVDRGQPAQGEEVAMRGGRILLRDFIPIHINGQSYGRLWYHTDITERKQAEEALKKAHDELECGSGADRGAPAGLRQAQGGNSGARAGRSPAPPGPEDGGLGTLTGGIAHDFNNILAAIIGFTELIDGHAPKGAGTRRHLKRIMEASIRGRELVRQMLTFSRKTEQEKKPLRLEQHRQGDRQAPPGHHAGDDRHQGRRAERVGLDPRQTLPRCSRSS